MPASVTSTVLGRNISRAAAAPLSTAGATSIDILTVNHGLTRSPHYVELVPRSVVAQISGGVPAAVVLSWNASVVTVALPSPMGASGAVQVDVIAVFAHSIVQ